MTLALRRGVCGETPCCVPSPPRTHCPRALEPCVVPEDGSRSPWRCEDRTEAPSGRSVCVIPERGVSHQKVAPCCRRWRWRGDVASPWTPMVHGRRRADAHASHGKGHWREDVWMAACDHDNSPPPATMKSRLPKCTCAPGTQLMSWLAIRGLVWNAQRPLPGAPTVGVSNKHRRVNL